MIVDLTYMGERKRKASRGSEHNSAMSKMASDYIVLKEQNREMLEESEKMRENLERLSKLLKQKDVECRNNKFKLG
jgi:ribosomal protein L17